MATTATTAAFLSSSSLSLPLPTAGSPAHLHHPVRQPFIAPLTARQPIAHAAWTPTAALTADRRIERIALGLLLTVVLPGLPLAIFLGALAHH